MSRNKIDKRTQKSDILMLDNFAGEISTNFMIVDELQLMKNFPLTSSGFGR